MVVSVGGMQCSCCAVSVEKAVRALPGVRQAGVFFLADTLDVQFSPTVVTVDKVLQAVRDAGFTATLVSSKSHTKAVTLAVGGMACSSCASAVETVLRAVPGVASATVSLTLGQAEVEYAEDTCSLKALVAAVEAAGFVATVMGQEEVNLAVLRISGMTCSSCAAGVEAALRALPGVLSASVNPLTGLAEVLLQARDTCNRLCIASLRDLYLRP